MGVKTKPGTLLSKETKECLGEARGEQDDSAGALAGTGGKRELMQWRG